MVSKKPSGYFKNILAFDCETTGLAFNSLDPTTNSKNGEHFQMVSVAFIVADMKTLKEVDRIYVEIKWNGTSTWSPGAEKVHGLSKEYLEENGLSEEEAVLELGKFIIKHFGTDNCIHLLGHNVATFDRYFLADLFERHDISLKFGNRHVDSFAIGVTLLEAYNSDQLFELSGLEERKLHNAMEDIEYTLESVRRMQKIFKSML